MAKLITIIKSRFKQQREEEWVKKRRETCLSCQYNSLNTQDTTLVQDFLAALSYFYSWITGRVEDEGTYGQCTACGCDCFFKSLEIENNCPKGKWKK